MPSSKAVSSIYGYKPSVGAAVIGAILLVLATILTIFLYFKHRAWFLYMLVLGALGASSLSSPNGIMLILASGSDGFCCTRLFNYPSY